MVVNDAGAFQPAAPLSDCGMMWLQAEQHRCYHWHTDQQAEVHMAVTALVYIETQSDKFLYLQNADSSHVRSLFPVRCTILDFALALSRHFLPLHRQCLAIYTVPYMRDMGIVPREMPRMSTSTWPTGDPAKFPGKCTAESQAKRLSGHECSLLLAGSQLAH